MPCGLSNLFIALLTFFHGTTRMQQYKFSSIYLYTIVCRVQLTQRPTIDTDVINTMGWSYLIDCPP